MCLAKEERGARLAYTRGLGGPSVVVSMLRDWESSRHASQETNWIPLQSQPGTEVFENSGVSSSPVDSGKPWDLMSAGNSCDSQTERCPCSRRSQAVLITSEPQVKVSFILKEGLSPSANPIWKSHLTCPQVCFLVDSGATQFDSQD